MVILIRSNEANPDPRLQKYINYLESSHQNYKVLAWNRGKENIKKANFTYFNLQTGYGLAYKNIPYKIAWFIFIFIYLIRNRKSYSLIHACDFDTMLPAYYSTIFTRKKIVFDVFDWFSNPQPKGFIKCTINRIENILFKKTDFAIICEKYRINQVNPKYRREFFVLPNIPSIQLKDDQDIYKKVNSQRLNYKYILSYVGVFDQFRGLEDILKFVSQNEDFCLNIAGYGYLENLVFEISEKYDNVIYWGKVDYNTGLNMMKNSDMIIAFYYCQDDDHFYAAPNKYYEGLFLGKAILTNNDTLLAQNTIKHDTGFVIQEGLPSISTFFLNQFNIDDVQQKNKNTKAIWQTAFENYTEKFMTEIYQKILDEK
ncbi:hypothetical protein FJQ98_06530 [Lysinibacillus agricola]|uniref:Glycosyl transferase family 1 domain-containing protein n=1 Tax=Lysinibacillus agricola TaxID=2590012 RepID=A0ABX7AUR2_9BACI|nr:MULTISPECIES: hypothetical protein [Lysinibacillus]KOS63008.1 hypothetical protein AN161_10445 [Lysinibacillus sp. FJAT-14222]QQP13703.1 hypothetical protein FJQ98_06530 [Lysinibacillus agricola]